MEKDSTPPSNETPTDVNSPTQKKGSLASRPEWLIALSAVLVSVATMAVYIYQAKIMQSQQLASVWPYIEWVTTFSTDDGVYLSVINKGVGPARVIKTHLFLDGKELTDPRQLLRIITNGKSDSLSIFGAGVDNRVIAPGEEVRLFHMTGKGIDITAMIKSFKRVHYTVCYCSIYDECWMSEGLKVVDGCKD